VSRALDRLLALRERELERLSAQMASHQAVAQRFRDNLGRLDALWQHCGASGELPAPASSTAADYKQAVMRLADTHRAGLAQHEAETAVAQRALSAAAGRHEGLSLVLAQRRTEARQAGERREQRQQDELAVQMWSRGRS